MTNGLMDGRTNNPGSVCPSNFFEVGGIKISDQWSQRRYDNKIVLVLSNGQVVISKIAIWLSYLSTDRNYFHKHLRVERNPLAKF